MKQFSIVFIFSLLFLSGYSQKKTGWKEYKLFGLVKSIHEFTFSASEKFGEVIKGSRDSTSDLYLTFDKTGNLISKKTVKENTIFSYNLQGQKTESNTYSDTTLIIKTIYKCDINNNVVEEIMYTPNGAKIKKTTYICDKMGNVIEENGNRKGLETQIIYKYDTKGNAIELSAYVMGNSISSTSKYDLKGNTIESHTIGGSIEKTETYKYNFDAKGNYTSKTIFLATVFRGIKKEAEASEIKERVIEYY
jgi:hypothetical protein